MKGTLSNWLPVNPPLTATVSLTTGSCFFRHTRKKIICSSFTGTNPAAAVKDKYIDTRWYIKVQRAVPKNNPALHVYLALCDIWHSFLPPSNNNTSAHGELQGLNWSPHMSKNRKKLSQAYGMLKNSWWEFSRHTRISLLHCKSCPTARWVWHGMDDKCSHLNIM